MRHKAGLAALAAATAIVFGALAPGGASGGSGGTGPGSGGSGSGGKGYVNPFKHGWYAGRIDMGVDYMPIRHRKPVVAIGKAKIIGSDSHSGWPGGHFIWYKLLRGDHKGDIIYVAETMKHLKHKGARVHAGQRIAVALPRGTGIEIGWAKRSGEPRAGGCYSEGMKTNSGKQMARFLRSLGAQVGDKVNRRGPDEPSGRRC